MRALVLYAIGLAFLVVAGLTIWAFVHEPKPDPQSMSRSRAPTQRITETTKDVGEPFETRSPSATTSIPADSGRVLDDPQPFARLMRVAVKQAYRGLLGYDDEVLELLAVLDSAKPLERLRRDADAGNDDAVYLLVRLEDDCRRLSETGEGFSGAERQYDLNVWIEGLDREEAAVLGRLQEQERAYDARFDVLCSGLDLGTLGLEARYERAIERDHVASLLYRAQDNMESTAGLAALQRAARESPIAKRRLARHYIDDGDAELQTQAIELLMGIRAKHPGVGYDLGRCYEWECIGLAPREQEALRWYRQGAERGHRPAITRYAHLLEQIDPESYGSEAHAWRLFAFRLNEYGCFGHDFALVYHDSLTDYNARGLQLSAYQYQRAQEMAGQLWETYGERARRERACD